MYSCVGIPELLKKVEDECFGSKVLALDTSYQLVIITAACLSYVGTSSSGSKLSRCILVFNRWCLTETTYRCEARGNRSSDIIW